mmetsp:Transcript_25070/g.43839  ORF Transcript_25070/g.43839 Transcript_25070/m.43839 type:complete len:89 (+) Transcript_25070:142-408(+)
MRETARRESEEPKQKKSKTDTDEPMRDAPKMDSVDDRRLKRRNANEAPRLKKSSTETVLPILAQENTDKEEPKRKNDLSDIAAPKSLI